MNTDKIRDNKQIQSVVTTNYLALADFVVGKSGPVKTYGEFCKLTGLSSQNFSPIQQRKRSVPLEAAVRACDVFDASYDWMFANRGEMFGKVEAMKISYELQNRIAKIEKKLNIKRK